jgi:fatty-acyl-CoA synthase
VAGDGVAGESTAGTVADLILARADDDCTAILFEDRRWSYREYVVACVERARLLLESRRKGPFHVGVLLENVPEYPMLLGAAALAGATIVGINPTRRGAELERDVRHADCQILVTEERQRGLLDGLDPGIPEDRLFDVDSEEWKAAVARYRGLPAPDVEIDPAVPYLLLFTSGTTGAPKAAVCSQGRLAVIGTILVGMQNFTQDDVVYGAMPMFHSNALMAGWAPALAAGATLAQRRRFSASGFLPDVRRFGVTYFNYVGKPLAYILATPEGPDDADNTLTRVFGNEASDRDIERFRERFGCAVFDAYGSTEGAISISKVPEAPEGSLGVGAPGTVVLDPETGKECPRSRFGDEGQLLNAEEAIGEIANVNTAASFEGYWNNEDANAERTRGGVYWSGDLGYRDDAGYIYFAGRNFDWLRVDGENFAAAPVERILQRHPDVTLAAVYAVPDSTVGDQVMAALALRPGAAFDPKDFRAFLDEQSDLGTKWAPRYVRIASKLPATSTNKILKRELRRERWECADSVWVRDDAGYRRLDPSGVEDIRREFVARNRGPVLDTWT